MNTHPSVFIRPARARDAKEIHSIGLKTPELRFSSTFPFHDLVQSTHHGEVGCLDKRGHWLKGTVHYRKILRLGRVRIYLKKGYLEGRTLFA